MRINGIAESGLPRAKRVAIALMMGAVALLSGCSNRDAADQSAAFDAKAQWAVEAYDAPVLSQSQLVAMIEADESADVLLVDTRSAREYRVSHLPGAVLWADFKDGPPPAEILEHAGAGRPVVFYCSIGYRSGLAAERVMRQAEGERPIFNLKGGIFQWANEGRPLDGGPRVHGYDDEWSQWLRADLRAPMD